MSQPWWKSAVVYQIYPRSFCDTDGDGVGDLEGIRRRLDHLRWLGVDAVWLSPFFPSPMADHGYDVSDYCDVDPLFGSLDGFDALLAECHRAGLRVLIDWVPNHTSDQHPWFVEARSTRASARRDWYVWRDSPPDRPGEPPNNWRAAFPDGPAWTWDEPTQQWYLHLFTPQQPDLNWSNPDVVAAMHDTLRFWLDRGVDGFRMDVIHAIGKDTALPDVTPDLAAIPYSALNDHESTHALLRDIRTLLDGYPGQRAAVGEVFLLDTATVAAYYGTPEAPELHMAFNFPPLFTRWDAAKWRRQIERAEATIGARHAWPTWVLSNHDNPRHRTRYGTDGRARAAAVLLLTLRGTPFLYAGEELGLEDADVPAELRQDPAGTRDGCRAPVPWDETAAHGWVVADNWLPWPPDADIRNARAERDDPASMANLYRRVLAARHASPALTVGTITILDGVPNDVLGYQRHDGDDERTVYVNFADTARNVDAGDSRIVVVSTRPDRDGAAFDGRLGPDEAVVLRRE